MLCSVARFSLLAFSLCLATTALAQECPAKGAEAITAGIAAQPTCGAAVRLLKTCTSGDAADVEPAQKAVAVCEGRFSKRVSKQRDRAYQRAKARCDARYANVPGSQSALSLCKVDAALATARASRRR